MESIEKIRKMLERFYQGETTLEEERLLQEYLSSEAPFRKSCYPTRNSLRPLRDRGDSIAVPDDLNQKYWMPLTSEEKTFVQNPEN